MNAQRGTTTLTLPTLGHPGDERDPFLDGVQAATKGLLEILGEIGRTTDGTIVYLARHLDVGSLVALRLVRVPGNENAYDLDILEELDSSLPAPPADCPACLSELHGWGRFCGQCGSDLSGVDVEGGVDTPTGLMRALHQAAAGKYEILGQMSRRQGGGLVYFAREMVSKKLVALRLLRAADEAYSIGVTRVMHSLVLDKGDPDPPPEDST